MCILMGHENTIQQRRAAIKNKEGGSRLRTFHDRGH